MANSSINLSSLDFDTLKQNFKNYLSTQSVFKDYNFEGSNINVLLDVMSYNTYLNSFYLNMIASEMFLDSAQKYDTVVSHAKELNYTPRSYASSVANVNLTATTVGITLPFTIPKGTTFTGTNSNGSFTFTTTQTFTYASPNTQYNVADLQIYEGTYVNNSFIVNYDDETQKFVLTNPNIDVNSMTVTVYENNKQTNTVFKKVDTLFGLNSQSNVYFLQAAQNGQYEILFGDGFLGRRPVNESLVIAEYLVSNGTDADGITSFSINNDLGTENNGQVSVTNLTVSSNSSGGANSEGIESIRFYAPRYFATQQRAVATDDYSSLILSRFGGTISDVNVYGGELLEPKQYGRVAVCLKPTGPTNAPEYVKAEVRSYLLDYISVPTRIIITDPDFFYCHVNSTVQYNKNLTTKKANEIKNIVINAIKNYAFANLEKFERDFRYSKFVNIIDTADSSIVSNNTEIKMVKKIAPKTNFLNFYDIDFGNQAHSNIHNHPVLESTFFTYITADGTNYPFSKMKDDNNGNIIVYTTINNNLVILDTIGTINYTTGKVTISNFNVASYDTSIDIHYYTLEKDIFIKKSQILLIDTNDVTINVVEEIK